MYATYLSEIRIYKDMSHCTMIYFTIELKIKGTAVAEWLRHCATNRKAAGSIPDGVTGISQRQ